MVLNIIKRLQRIYRRRHRPSLRPAHPTIRLSGLSQSEKVSRIRLRISSENRPVIIIRIVVAVPQVIIYYFEVSVTPCKCL